jgi:signal transduction histidine kinase/ActR/RegA family two-component response regulator
MSVRPLAGLSFQARITAAAMGTSVCVLIIACALFAFQQWSADRARIVMIQHRVTTVLAPRLSEGFSAGNAKLMDQVLSDGAIANRLLNASFKDPQGRVLARFDNKDAENELHGAEVISKAPVVASGRLIGTLEISSSLEAPARFLPRYLALTGALFFAATGFSLFLGRLLARRVVEPVGRLSQVMGEVAVSGDLARRVEPAEDDEFGRLIDSFNTLLDRLHANDLELRRTMTDLVEARDQAQAANVQKSQFLANMSHEIRTPLNGVLAMAQIMALGELGPDQRSRLAVISNSGEALLTILNDILDVSKIEAGALELESLEFDIKELVQSSVEGFSAVAQGKDLKLTVEVQPSAAGVRLGDPARLRQILSNLISNALKFTEEGGVAVRLEGQGEDGQAGVRMIVRDSGIGMQQDKLSLLFQKFTQLDASTTRRFGGTGLGLAICHELTAMMGGAIWAQSVEGEGSAFFVDLPLPRVGPAVIQIAEEDGEIDDEDRPLRILAAEDNPTNQLVLSTILEMFGAELQIVDNGKLAVDAMEHGAFDIVLMDIQMPVMDGITAAKAIRQAERATGRRRTPIIAVSANAMAHQVEEYLSVGMDSHVAKPIQINRLQEALEAALSAPEPDTAPQAREVG